MADDTLAFLDGRFLKEDGSVTGADVISKGAQKILILPPRVRLIYPATVPNWLDIRLGVFISLTKKRVDAEDPLYDDNPAGLAETLTTAGDQKDRLWLGFKSNNDTLPRGTNFFGISNSPAVEATGSSVLESIEANTRWRSKFATSQAGVAISNGATLSVSTAMHPFRTIQDPVTLGGSSSLVLLRMTRATVSDTVDHFYVEKTSPTADGGFDYADAGVDTNDPLTELVRDNLASATWTEVMSAKTLPGITSSPGNAFYAYWPFNNSRLRIHNIVVEKFA